jgi:protein-S-isoprenylcysteine O-methyltransferase Ste14
MRLRGRLHRPVLFWGLAVTGWSWAALGLYLVGLGLAFGVRTWAHWRRSGSTGFRGISGCPGSLPWWGGVLFPAALILGLAAPVLAATAAVPLIGPLARPAIAVAGLLLALVGLVVVLAAQSAMGASWRIGVDEAERTELVTTGLFRRVRNPIFTGMAAVAAGVLLMAPTVVAVLALACLIAAVEIQVRAVEEPYLARVHGETYQAYVASSGRFVPKLSGITSREPTDG